jgi:non-canonical purine NTP pyrophosphatase (RdgB/HAM1 family)
VEGQNAVEPLILISGNPHKWIEAQRLLGAPLQRLSIALPEIQAASLEDITRYKLEAARSQHRGRLIVEDVSLGLDALGGFPGPYIHWLLASAGGDGLAAIARGLEDRSARARCSIGFWNGSEAKLFLGEAAGTILQEPRGSRSFGWDAWFEPKGAGKTYAEMTGAEKDTISHRGAAYRELARFLRA